MADPIEALRRLSILPADDSEFNQWIECRDGLQFLEDNARQNHFVVYASGQHAFMHTVFIPMSAVSEPDTEDILEWSGGPDSGWGLSYGLEPSSLTISPPFEDVRCRTLTGAQQLVFARHFEGRRGDKRYFEILQPFVQTLDLHYLPERSAYCRLTHLGDIDDVIKIVSGDDGTAITVQLTALEEWMVLTDSVLFRMFDFTRVDLMRFGGWSDRAPSVFEGPDLWYRGLAEPGRGGYVHGAQVIRPSATRAHILARLNGSDVAQEHVTFLAHDWKNGVLREISCAPGSTANYFIKSDLPFETSPAFFRPEVLTKYKADSDKYRLQDRSLSCRGAWSLKTYDINTEGQVHTYICYLRDLPHEEQLHWRAYNEAPRAPISSRALKTDFEGSWHVEADPLSSLRGRLDRWRRAQVAWWTLRDETLPDKVHYPVTTSADEWANELLHLDQLTVEGFEKKWCQRKAKELGRNPEVKFGSLKLIEECLIGLGFEEEHAKLTLRPFHELHDLRSKVKGHAGSTTANALKEEAIRAHKSFKAHFSRLCADCDESLADIGAAFGFDDKVPGAPSPT